MASPFIKQEPNMENSSPAGPSARPSRPPLSEVQNKPDLPSQSYRHDEFKANKGINDASQFATGVPEDPTTVTSTERKKSDLKRQKLLEKIQERSEATDYIGALMEWVFMLCTIFSSNTGICLCGNESLEYLFQIKNVKNGKVTQLGRCCLEHIPKDTGSNLRYVLGTAQAMFVQYRGMLVHLIAQQGDELKIRIDKSSSILKYRTELTAMYPGGIPLDQNALIAKAGCDEVKPMIAGRKYKIWVKLYADDENATNLTLKAEVIKAKIMN